MLNETNKAPNSRKAIRVTKMPMTTIYMIPYLMIYNIFAEQHKHGKSTEISHNPAALSFLLDRIQWRAILF